MELASHRASSKATCCALSPATSGLVVGYEDGSISSFELVKNSGSFKNGGVSTNAAIHSSYVTSIASSHKGSILSGSKDGTILFRNKRGAISLHLDDHLVNHVEFLPNQEELILAALNHGAVSLCSVEDTSSERRLPVLHAASSSVISALPLSNDLMASTGTDSTVQICDLRSNSGVHNLALASWGFSLASGKDMKVLVGCKHGAVCAFDLRKGDPSTPLFSLQAHVYGVKSMSTTADGRLLATGSSDRKCKVWRMDPAAREEFSLQGVENGVSGVSISGDGRALATSSFDGTVRVFDLAFQERRRAQCFSFWTRVPRDIEEPLVKFLW